jgi:hypothetical protein
VVKNTTEEINGNQSGVHNHVIFEQFLGEIIVIALDGDEDDSVIL